MINYIPTSQAFALVFLQRICVLILRFFTTSLKLMKEFYDTDLLKLTEKVPQERIIIGTKY